MKLRTTLYVTFSPQTLTVHNIRRGTGVSYDLSEAAPDANPFYHERVVIGDFDAALALIEEGVRDAVKGSFMDRFYKFIIVMHPLRPLAGGLSSLEERALLELAREIGAREAFVWTGAELSPEEVLAERYKG